MNRPNIVFIFMDDMGWRDLGCTGSSFYETPNIDRLAREGMQFGNAYASCPVCSPSRASFHTGQYPARVGITDWIDNSGTFHPLHGDVIDAPYLKKLPFGIPTIASILRDNGYTTWHVGKWHLGGSDHYPTSFGFEKNIAGCSWGHPAQGYFVPYGIETLPEGPEGEYLTDRLTDEAISLIRNVGSRPFFLNFCHYAVHTPIEAKEEDIRRFEKKAADLGLDRIPPFEDGEDFIPDELKGRHVVRRVVQSDPVYAAMLWNLDQNIGRLMDVLEETGKAENTLVIFTSDNGGLSTAEGSPTCNLPAREGKGWTMEGGIRVPLIARFPGKITPGTRCDVPVITMDHFPTFLHYADIDVPSELTLDGVDISPLYEGRSITDRPLFWHYPHYGNQGGHPSSVVHCGNYKYIEFLDDSHGELYDLRIDFSERRDIASENPDIVKELSALLHEWQTAVGARFPEKR